MALDIRWPIRLLLARPWLILALGLICEAAILAVTQIDFVVSDPLWYAHLSSYIADDPTAFFTNPEAHPFVMRVGLTLPLAGLYRLFGISAFVSVIPVMLAAIGILLVAYAAAPTPRAKLFAVLFVLTSTPVVRHATTLGVDLPCAALMAWSVL